MRKLTAVVVLALTLVGFNAAPAQAQGEFRFGGAFSGVTLGEGYGYGPGIGFDLAYFLHIRNVNGQPRTAMSVFGDMSLHWFDYETDLFVMGGVREHFMLNTRVNPYIHAFGGVTHWTYDGDGTSSGTEPIFGGGGGVEYWLHPRFAARAQYDLILANYGGEWDSVHRFTFGGTFKF